MNKRSGTDRDNLTSTKRTKMPIVIPSFGDSNIISMANGDVFVGLSYSNTTQSTCAGEYIQSRVSGGVSRYVMRAGGKVMCGGKAYHYTPNDDTDPIVFDDRTGRQISGPTPVLIEDSKIESNGIHEVLEQLQKNPGMAF